MGLFSVLYSTLSGRGASLCAGHARRKALTGRGRFLLAIALCCLWPASIPAQAHHAGGVVAVVGNPGLPVTNLSMHDVRRLFLGETRFWKGNLPVVLVVPPTGTHERYVLLHDVYRMNEAQYKQYWISRILRGEAITAPKTAESRTAVQKLVASLPGCVTVLRTNQATTSKNMKLLKVDGKSPGDKEYPLR